MKLTTANVNPEIDQDRTFDLFDHYKKTGDPLFHQQRTIYENIANEIKFQTILEAGCGNGVGTAIFANNGLRNQIMATDKLKANIDFAAKLYPYINFDVWDLNKPTEHKAGAVVCVEAFEHVENPQAAMNHLLAATISDLWISTPNGKGKTRPPENPYHVCEYTPEEMFGFISSALRSLRLEAVNILHWETFEELDIHTDIDPLVYRIQK